MKMKNFVALWVCMLAFQFLFAQQPAEETPIQTQPENYTLRERYSIMKAKSQSFKEYKVVKESVMDGVWKITRDSLAAKDVTILAANKNIEQLKKQVAQVKDSLQKKEQSMAATLHDSTHISVLGIDIQKSAFLTIFAVLLVALAFVIVTLAGRMKMINKSLHEKKLTINMLTNEYEEYKRRAMEKQTKLSRELQDERNKLSSIRNS
jgi:F0F1-type ATP synthase membrane subunit b/b'